MTKVDLLLAVPDGAGWAPLHSAAQLLGGYLGTTPKVVDIKASLGKFPKLLGLLPRSKGKDQIALVLAYDPGQLNAIAQLPYAFKGYSAVYGWVIDSFWDDRIPRLAKANTTYQKIFVTDPADVEEWKSQGVKAVGYLPWGSDVWGSWNQRLNALEQKTTDLLRVGRQPQAWEDDQATSSLAHELGLAFEGRPAFGKTDAESARYLQNALARSKAVLAFSVHVSPAPYTHPSKDYITARWLDALSWGALVVGQKPDSLATEDLLWDGATLDISPTDLRQGLKESSKVLMSLKQDYHKRNLLFSLKKLDWRWRFKELFEEMGLNSVQLNYDLAKMQEVLDQEEKSHSI